jgi:hypothetical protein
LNQQTETKLPPHSTAVPARPQNGDERDVTSDLEADKLIRPYVVRTGAGRYSHVVALSR